MQLEPTRSSTRSRKTPFAVICLMFLLPSGLPAQPPALPAPAAQPADPEAEAQDRGWPRKFEAADHEIIVHTSQGDREPVRGHRGQ